jgi:hypothetical protein
MQNSEYNFYNLHNVFLTLSFKFFKSIHHDKNKNSHQWFR